MLPLIAAELLVARHEAQGSQLVRATLLTIDSDGRIWVRDPEGRRLACDVLQAAVDTQFEPGDELLVAAGQGQSAAVVLGRIGRCTPSSPRAQLTIEATESVVLKCGGASINLRSDGKVMIHGEDVLLRAKGTQRIRAGTVSIN